MLMLFQKTIQHSTITQHVSSVGYHGKFHDAFVSGNRSDAKGQEVEWFYVYQNLIHQ